jgi:arylsulfatase
MNLENRCPQKAPNILFITTDQQRFDASGGAGPGFLRTPHYDQLRREGVTFTRAYSDCPICVPARVSMMTGKYSTTHGATGNVQTSEFMGREETLPGQLRSLGYATAAIGKMHFGPQRTRHGFDEMIIPEDYYREMTRSGNPQQPMRHGLGQNELYATMATVPECLTLTSWTAEKSLEYIRDRRDPNVPFFLWCSFSKPHPPFDPPEPYYSMYRNSDIPEPVVGGWALNDDCPVAFRRQRERFSFDLLDSEIVREARSAYYGLITQIDYNIGRVFQALQDHDLFNDTLIIYTSDHGELMGDHLSGAKFFFYEGSAHVPMVVRMPRDWGGISPGLENDSVVTHADILPTILAAAGGTVPDDVDGLDLLSLERGETQPRRYLHATLRDPENCDYLAVTDGRWKYIYYPEGASEQLFDLASDPNELTDMANDAGCDAQLQEMRAEVISWHTERNTGRVIDGCLPQRPLENESLNLKRSQSWPGYHSEAFEKDVRH